MGQTLTHGIYLPDEGERNCYNGLAANWQLLDGAVGTVAEHTSQIAGKAPLVHTHSKADVTDLFNSANTWSASQTFTANSIFSNFITSKEVDAISAGGYGKGIAFRDYQNNRLGYIQPYLTSNSEKRLVIGADSGDIASNSNLIPNANNSVNLGSSSYQWNNIYAKKVNTQSVNGVNPGALSLPSNTYTGTNAIVEISGWASDGTNNSYSPPADGWLSISNGGSIYVWGVNTAFGMHTTDNIAIPLRYGETYNVSMTHTPDFCRFYPCLGNV